VECMVWIVLKFYRTVHHVAESYEFNSSNYRLQGTPNDSYEL